jgi:hypothetical protein
MGLPQTAKIQLGCHAIRNLEKQAKPVVFTTQGLLVHMPLNCDTCDVAGVLDQLEILGFRAARFSIIERESAKSLASLVNNGRDQTERIP